MTETELTEIVLQELANIAPEVKLELIDPEIRFRDQFEFDSIDCLNLISALEKRLGIYIQEMDYPKLATLSSCVSYLQG